jgi:hypothetical protein
MAKHHFKLLVLIIVLIAAFGIIYASQKMQSKDAPSYTVPLLAEAKVPHETSVISPDGELTLVMNEEESEEGIIYTFFVVNSENGLKSKVLTKVNSSGETISVPDNTFSPDKKYFFLKEESSGQASYIVLKTSGELITEDSQTINVSSLFMAKYSDYIITDMTGWGGINLIIINTDKTSGGTGPSFWFDVPYKSFIQLSSRFD